MFYRLCYHCGNKLQSPECYLSHLKGVKMKEPDIEAQLDDRDLTLEQIQKKCYETAKYLGWTEKEVPIPEMIALIHSEASEALEEYRHNKPISYNNSATGKPEGIASEFADIIIRIGHYAEVLKIDLQKEVLRKLAYNRTRGYRHGGLKA